MADKSTGKPAWCFRLVGCAPIVGLVEEHKLFVFFEDCRAKYGETKAFWTAFFLPSLQLSKHSGAMAKFSMLAIMSFESSYFCRLPLLTKIGLSF